MTRVNFDTSCNFHTFHWYVICPYNDSDRLINWSVANKFTTKSIACLSSVMIVRISRRLSGASMLESLRRDGIPMVVDRSIPVIEGKEGARLSLRVFRSVNDWNIYRSIPLGELADVVYRFQSNRLPPTESSTHAFLLFVIAIVRFIAHFVHCQVSY